MADESPTAPALTAGERARVLLPWLLGLAVAGAGAFTLGGVERAMSVGAFGASALGALLAVTQLRGSVASMRRWMSHRESDLSTFADDRAAAVARQFAWAVDELVGLRAELRRVDALRTRAEEVAATAADGARRDAEELRLARAKLSHLDASGAELLKQKLDEAEATASHQERERRSAEKRLRAAEQRIADFSRTLRLVARTVSSGDGGRADRGPGPLMFDWTLEYDGSSRSLRLRCTSLEVRATRARILDASGRLVTETPETRRRRATLVLRIPQSVAAAVESGDWSAFRLEVQVGEVWHGAALVDRGESVSDEYARAHDAQAIRPAAIRIVS